MKVKTLEEIAKEIFHHEPDIRKIKVNWAELNILAKAYAEQFIDLAAKRAFAIIVAEDEVTGEEYEVDPGFPCWASVENESILRIKELIK